MSLPRFVREPIQRVLHDYGYEKMDGDEYQRITDEGIAAISFIRDRSRGPATDARFTAHLGYWSRLLGQVFGPEQFSSVEPHAVHWYRWISYLSEADSSTDDIWWVFESHPEGMAAVIAELESRAVPALRRYASDAGLRDAWLQSPDPFLHKSEQTAYLSVLVDVLGPEDQMEKLRTAVARLADSGSSDALAAMGYLRNQP